MGAEMMGRRNQHQGQFFYEFCLDESFPTIISCGRSGVF
jgi:hypothetical protein